MIKRLIRVPDNEQYYFCKRLFFSIFGDSGAVFANTLEDKGWLGYPYNRFDGDSSNILLFSNRESLLNTINLLSNVSDDKFYTKYKIGIIVTDAKDILAEELNFFDEIKDISSLKDYYQTELSLLEFIKDLGLKGTPVD